MEWFKERLKERSTWRGLALLGGALGVAVDPALIETIGVIVAGSIATTETVIPEVSAVK